MRAIKDGQINYEIISDELEDSLKTIIKSGDFKLYEMMAYHLGWNTTTKPNSAIHIKRNHGLTTLISSEAIAGEHKIALPAATAIELVKTFSEVHDDVQSGIPMRNNRDTVWWVWGPAQAINVGDGLHALARLALLRLKNSNASAETTLAALQMLDKAGLELCEGIFQNLESQERIDLTIDSYLEMAEKKTGSLFGCAMAFAPLFLQSDKSLIEAMYTLGKKIGVAREINQDLNSIWCQSEQDEHAMSEVLNKKKLAPVVHAFENAKISQKRKLGDIYFKRVLDPKDLGDIQEVLEEVGSKTYCEQLSESYVSKGIDKAKKILPSDTIEILAPFINELVSSK